MQAMCRPTCSFYRFIRCEVEFEVWILWLASLSRNSELIFPPRVFNTDHLRRFTQTSDSASWQEGWLGAACCSKASVYMCAATY